MQDDAGSRRLQRGQLPRAQLRRVQSLSATQRRPGGEVSRAAAAPFRTREMSPGKPSGKSSCKATRQILFLEAVSQLRPMSSSTVPPDPNSMDALVNPCPHTAMEHILQEISAVGRHKEAMDSKIMDLSADSKSIQADIASFQAKITYLVHRLHTVESTVATLLDNEPELQFPDTKSRI
ncbi:hypothetical protein NDU88_002879 [Pleurodeles waltl]|uniref:Uncharacterized protein n=1 Tax=Pleurodeles waltl TaxID=8319 RepID=A0AAV7T4X0_PLEWA|nr:hypothetical protein NDU88_002879 [Pleurodeles waltl]